MPLHNNSDETLLQLRSRDKKAFEELYNQNFISVFYFAKRFVPDQLAAEDITSETFLKLWDRISEFQSLASIKSFLHITTKNACLNHLRNTKRRTTNEEQLMYLLQQGKDEALETQQLTAEIYQHIYEEVEKLAPQLKKVFQMAYIDGLSNEEIAQLLGINNQSVRNDKSRALKQIRLAMIDKNLYGIFLIWLALQTIPIKD